MIFQIAAGLVGFVLAYALMPWVMRLAREYGVLDYPDNDRRLHPEPIPRLGGVAVFLAAVVTAALVAGAHGAGWTSASPVGHLLPGVAIGALIVFVTGIVDDVRGVSPTFKLVAQTVAALVAIGYGFRVDTLTLTGGAALSLGPFAIPITLLWIVGITNAFNLIDGIDGLAATCALIALTACIATEALVAGPDMLLISFALIGALFAFLRFNRSPARVFLGDSGSMLLGYFLSIRIAVAATTPDHVTYGLIPLFALAYPLTDTFVAMARRWLRGHPFARADGRHIHHQILALGLSPRRSVDLIGLFFAAVAFMGMSIVFAPPQVTLALAIGGGVLMFAAFFYGVRWLRYSEFIEFGASIASVLLNARRHVRTKIFAADVAERVARADSLDEVTRLLADSAADFNLLEIALIPGVAHFPAPAARQISPLNERPFRIDYPIALEHEGQIREVVLRFWCARPLGHQHPGAERIATRLGPAVEAWLRKSPDALTFAEDHRRPTPRGMTKIE
jgi:UDP-GlcNAc:undecaprenyl-phosphate GlcNAc-1-phosphate transferase